MILLSREQILYLHSKLINATGGIDGIRDEGLLDSALQTPFQVFGVEELYPSVPWKAARLCYGLMIQNHAFYDGNKRIGVYAMLVFLELNGMETDCCDEELVNLGLGVASGEMKDEDIVDWILRHTK
ncbi:MAG: type II toxin-antitoxin system death-on-curing family toxin [Lachnospiraceae bacterium]|nr:type II toxin-antitoxin system death-on-curing family toxin [Lachnospiraceae bacterium]